MTLNALKTAWPKLKLAGAAGIGVYGAANSYFEVKEGQVAIVCGFSGIKDKVYSEGIHLIIPWIDRPLIYNTRPQSHLMNFSFPDSRGSNTVKVGVQVVSHPVPDKIHLIQTKFGDEKRYKEFMRELVNVSLETSISRYSSSGLTSHKEKVRGDIHGYLREVFEKDDIVIQDVSIDSVRIGK